MESDIQSAPRTETPDPGSAEPAKGNDILSNIATAVLTAIGVTLATELIKRFPVATLVLLISLAAVWLLARRAQRWDRHRARRYAVVLGVVVGLGAVAWLQPDTRYGYLGLAYHAAGQYESAIRYYTIAIRYNDRRVDLYEWRSNANRRLNRLGSAARDLGDALFLRRDYEGALEQFTKSARLNWPNLPDRYNRARTINAMPHPSPQRLQLAVQDLRAVRAGTDDQIDAEHRKRALKHLGQIQRKLAQLQVAKRR